MINPEIQGKIKFFTDSVRANLGDNLKKIILFGSRARGDYQEGSDYDFVIIVGSKDSTLRDKLSNIGIDFLNRYDELASEIVFDEKEWQKQKKFLSGSTLNAKEKAFDPGERRICRNVCQVSEQAGYSPHSA